MVINIQEMLKLLKQGGGHFHPPFSFPGDLAIWSCILLFSRVQIILSNIGEMKMKLSLWFVHSSKIDVIRTLVGFFFEP